MDALSIIVSALVLGIASGLRPTAEQAIKDSYSALKALVQNRYQINLANLELDPSSDAQKAAVSEALKKRSATDDTELIEKAAFLIEAIEAQSPEAVKTVGVNLRDVKAGIAKFRNVRADLGATGVNVDGGEFDQLDFGDVNAGTDPKK